MTKIGNIGLRSGESKTINQGPITIKIRLYDDNEPARKPKKRRAWCLWLCKT